MHRPSDDDESSAAAFIDRWQPSGSGEHANYQMFLAELCDLLGVPRPQPSVAEDAGNLYVFERNVRFQHGDGSVSTGRIDLYKRGCFVLETKRYVPAPAGDGRVRFAGKPAQQMGSVRRTRRK